MFCSECSANNEEGANFCSKCGSEIVHDAGEVTPEHSSNSNAPDEYYKTAIGSKNTDYYFTHFKRFDSQGIKVSWNWSAFFVSFYWLLYRKMWGWGVLYFILSVLFFVLSPTSRIIYIVSTFTLFPMYANAIYYRHINKEISKVNKFYSFNSEGLPIISSKGGTEKVFLIIMIIITLGGPLTIAAYQDSEQRAKVAKELAAKKAEEARKIEVARKAEEKRRFAAAKRAEETRIAEIRREQNRFIYTLDPGDPYYISGTFSNEKVVVVRIKPESNQVKVRRYKDGEVLWVDADDLLSFSENRNEKVGDAAAIFGMVACMWADNQKECSDNVRRLRARKTDTKYGSQ